MKQRSLRIRARQDAEFANIVEASKLQVPSTEDWSTILDEIARHGGNAYYLDGNDYAKRMRNRINQIARLIVALQSRHKIGGRNIDFRHFRRTRAHGFTFPTFRSLQKPYFGVVLHNITIVRASIGTVAIDKHAVESTWSFVADERGITCCAVIGAVQTDIVLKCRSVPEVIRKLAPYVENL